MSNGLKWIWKEAVVTQFKVLSLCLLERLRKITEDVSQDSLSQGPDLNLQSPKYVTGVQTMWL
jgi:hypothetical protein